MSIAACFCSAAVVSTAHRVTTHDEAEVCRILREIRVLSFALRNPQFEVSDFGWGFR
jgi:hypothetical protein